jgi:glycosyltransferase involved in cell wall biosynthesis
MRLLLREHGICGGTETVNIHLVQQFTQLVEQVIWIVPHWRQTFFQKILPPSDRLMYELPDWPREARFPTVLRKATSFALRQRNVPARFAVQQLRDSLSDLWLNKLIRQHGITHCFCNWIFGIEAPRIDVPLAAMVMDVRWKRYPDTLPRMDIQAIEKQFCSWLKRSAVVFPVSEATAADIRRFFPGHHGKIRVVPHGADPYSHARVSPNGLDRSDRCMFLCPAGADGHKNHLTLFQACAELFSRGFDFDVVLTGLGTDHFDFNRLNGNSPRCYDPAVESARNFLHQHRDSFGRRIKPLGYVGRAQLDAIYRECSAVVLPSVFEGFGLPLVEALQTAAKIICSDIPAHREQLSRYGCADQVAIFKPSDSGALAGEMANVLNRPDVCNSRRLPIEALKRWTWRHAATSYLDSLAELTPLTSTPETFRT